MRTARATVRARRHEVHAAPARVRPDEAAEGAGEQDAQEQARHHEADGLAALLGPREGGGEGDEELRGAGGEAEAERGGAEKGKGRGGGGREGHDDGRGEHREGESAPLPDVAEGDDGQHPEGVAHLGEGRGEAGPALGDAEVRRDLGEERLKVVEVADGDRASDGERPARRGGEGVLVLQRRRVNPKRSILVTGATDAGGSWRLVGRGRRAPAGQALPLQIAGRHPYVACRGKPLSGSVGGLSRLRACVVNRLRVPSGPSIPRPLPSWGDRTLHPPSPAVLGRPEPLPRPASLRSERKGRRGRGARVEAMTGRTTTRPLRECTGFRLL